MLWKPFSGDISEHSLWFLKNLVTSVKEFYDHWHIRLDFLLHFFACLLCFKAICILATPQVKVVTGDQQQLRLLPWGIGRWPLGSRSSWWVSFSEKQPQSTQRVLSPATRWAAAPAFDSSGLVAGWTATLITSGCELRNGANIIHAKLSDFCREWNLRLQQVSQLNRRYLKNVRSLTFEPVVWVALALAVVIWRHTEKRGFYGLGCFFTNVCLCRKRDTEGTLRGWLRYKYLLAYLARRWRGI